MPTSNLTSTPIRTLFRTLRPPLSSPRCAWCRAARSPRPTAPSVRRPMHRRRRPRPARTRHPPWARVCPAAPAAGSDGPTHPDVLPVADAGAALAGGGDRLWLDRRGGGRDAVADDGAELPLDLHVDAARAALALLADVPVLRGRHRDDGGPHRQPRRPRPLGHRSGH
ncbi:hypothetical protein Ddc_19727 [Ditylenchus destructor]|nr:hypothetical protein Ddc_19727 [Ditylenchus destructor]